MAMAGLHPVVAVYATFLNRAFDQLLMDVALHQLRRDLRPRPGRGDGCGRRQPPRHVGHVDPAGRARSAARPRPATATRLRQALATAVTIDDAPTRDPLLQGRGARRSRRRRHAIGGSTCCCRATEQPEVLVVAYGAMAAPVSRSAGGCPTRASASRSSTRVWAMPVNPALLGARRASTSWWSASRTTAWSAAAVRAWPRSCGSPAWTPPMREFGIAAGVPRARHPGRAARAARADAAGDRPLRRCEASRSGVARAAHGQAC